jgi:TPR repeat protein
MRRQDIQLLATARSGDPAARCELGRRYLLGERGFFRHPTIGLEYLSHPTVAGSERASVVIAEALPLHDIVRFEQHRPLLIAAKAGSATAQVKLGLWNFLTCRDGEESRVWLERAARSGHLVADAALRLMAQCPAHPPSSFLVTLGGASGIDYECLMPWALRRAASGDDQQLLERTLRCALEVVPQANDDLADAVCEALECAARWPGFGLPPSREMLEGLLKNAVVRENPAAALILGRAFCGLDQGPLRHSSIVASQNMRKGAALLLRAADAGKEQAWMLLYRVHSDNHASVANPLMARFFLEKAAAGGNVLAQRRLGALILKSAASSRESERGIQWLHVAAEGRDPWAAELLASLVLPVSGTQEEAAAALDAVRQEDPWLACRLRTARDFGLTRQEALGVDLVAGMRPWGLLVGPLSSAGPGRPCGARAIPALTGNALLNLRRSAAFLEHARREGAIVEGDPRKRSMRLRQLLERCGVDEALFFARAKSTKLNALRRGTKWAFHARRPLSLALSA